MVNPFTRLFAYPILERELNNRIAERDTIIAEQKEKIAELEDRLFVRFGLPAHGVDLSSSKGVLIPPYRNPRQRVRDMLTPPVTELNAEEQATIENSLTQ